MKIWRRNGPNFNSPILWSWILWAVCLPLLLVLLSFPLDVRTVEAQTPGDSGPTPPNPDRPYDEAEAQAIHRRIMCPICAGQTIDQSTVPLALQMRQMVRDQLSQGASQAEILEFFAQRYGPDILASPPKSGFNLLAWVFPVVGMATALIAGWLVIRSMASRRLTGSETAVSPQPELEPFLNQVDAEIGLERANPASPAGHTSQASTASPASNEGQPDVESRGLETQEVETGRAESLIEGSSSEGGSFNNG